MNDEINKLSDQNSQSYTDEQLLEIRNKTFNPELSSLIEKVTDTKKTDTDSKGDTNEADPLLKRLNALIYRLYARKGGAELLSDIEQEAIDYRILEYELQCLEIDHYAVCVYNEEKECFSAVQSVMLDKQYISIHSQELRSTLCSQYHISGRFVFISLYSLLQEDNNFAINRLLPIIVFERKGWHDSLFVSLLHKTSLVPLLLQAEINSNSSRPKMKILKHKIHSKLIRLQHNYIVLSGSVCYIIRHHKRKRSEAAAEFLKIRETLLKTISDNSHIYILNETNCLLFLSREDIHNVHNKFLVLRETMPELILYDLEDFKGRNFLASVYGIAYSHNECNSVE